jgi:hypothetical protein
MIAIGVIGIAYCATRPGPRTDATVPAGAGQASAVK